MKFLPAIVVLLWALTGCNSASQSQEAIRQAVIDSVASKVNVGAMDVDVTSISFKGAEADATVSFRPKGSKSGGMEMRYTLEQKSGKWVVKDKAQEGGGAPQWSDAGPRRDGDASRPPIRRSGWGQEVKRVAVLGGGPAGAFAAAQLAGAGLRTVVLDEKLAWENPAAAA